MAIRPQISISVREEGEVGTARRRAQQMATNVGFDPNQVSQLAIVVSEAATNLVKHGGGGEVLLREMLNGLEVLAIDKGRGMRDVSTALTDGYSTSGTAGNGLGAIRRLSSFFDIYSQRDSGTAILSQTFLSKEHPLPKLNFGAVCRPKHGETLAGDGWAEKEVNGESWILVADGLGHGPDANEAAREAVKTFLDIRGSRATTDCIEALHGSLRKTRGAAVAVVRLDHAQKQLSFCGVGNIAASITGDGASRSMISHNGILGHEVRRIQEFNYPWNRNSKLIMSSDGLATWHLEKYAGLLQKHPALIAGVLYRDFWRQRDDVTVVVAQESV
jgi:anti-sigma regulatory factor (Ser/Thr protein kinase)